MSNSNKKPETTMVERVRLGDALAALGRKIGLTNEDFAVVDQVWDKTPAEPTKFVGCCSGLQHPTETPLR